MRSLGAQTGRVPTEVIIGGLGKKPRTKATLRVHSLEGSHEKTSEYARHWAAMGSCALPFLGPKVPLGRVLRPSTKHFRLLVSGHMMGKLGHPGFNT